MRKENKKEIVTSYVLLSGMLLITAFQTWYAISTQSFISAVVMGWAIAFLVVCTGLTFKTVKAIKHIDKIQDKIEEIKKEK